MINRKFLIGLFTMFSILSAQFAVFAAKKDDKAVKFKVRIENVSDAMGQTASNGTKWPFALSPGMFVVHKNEVALFKEGKAATAALELQAEDGNPAGLIEMLEMRHHGAMLHGIYNTPVGAMSPAPVGPSGVYEFTFEAANGMKLSLALMFGQSNDLFYAPEPKGVELFDKNGKPLMQDITDKLILWDAGTEVNQEPGVGADQAPRQKAANTGVAEKGVVKKAKDSVFYKKNNQLFRVTITPMTQM